MLEDNQNNLHYPPVAPFACCVIYVGRRACFSLDGFVYLLSHRNSAQNSLKGCTIPDVPLTVFLICWQLAFSRHIR